MGHPDRRQGGAAVQHPIEVGVAVVAQIRLIVFQHHQGFVHLRSRLRTKNPLRIVFVEFFRA